VPGRSADWECPGAETCASGPVDEVRVCRRLALALLVDRSQSMMDAKLEMVKDAVHVAVDRLARKDCITIIAFDSEPTRVVALRAATDPRSIRTALNGLRARGGTAVYPAIDMAYRDLMRATRAKGRLIVLFSDGFSLLLQSVTAEIDRAIRWL
jgi:uncharacterized protein with von Willebrand factor type A (vWA) domain